MSYNFNALSSEYQTLVDTMQVKDSWLGRLNKIAGMILAGKARYVAVSEALGGRIPWQFIGIVHYREGDCSFRTHLHNGDSLQHRTMHVPAGRPRTGRPPFTWEESATDALGDHNLALIDDWTDARFAFELEQYNGFGYRGKGIHSPYVWAGTNHYIVGKYVADGQFDPNAREQQCGGMALLARLRALDIPKPVLIDNSRKLKVIRRAKGAIAATVGGLWSLDYLQMLPAKLAEFKALGLDYRIWLAVGGIALVWLVFNLIEHYIEDDYKSGAYTPSGMRVDTTSKEIAQ